MSARDKLLNLIEYIFDHDRYKERKMRKLVEELKNTEGGYDTPDLNYNIQ